MANFIKKIFILALIILLAIAIVYLVRTKQAERTAAVLVSTITTPEDSQDDQSKYKTFKFDNFHGSTNISDKFELQYPANWYNDGQYFSPQKVKFYTKYEAKAPIYFDLILADIFDYTEFKYQIDKSKRIQPDDVGQIDGREFRRYYLIDYGTYGGESAGKVKIFVGPKINIDGEEYYLVFHWEEKPLAEPMEGNSVEVFDNMMLSLKFIK